MKVYRSGESWPTTSLPAHWVKPMEQAQAAGWTLYFYDAPHTFAVLGCPADENAADRHTFKIDHTAKGSAFFASEATKKVKKCAHGTPQTGSKVKQRVAHCEDLLQVAETLIESVGRDLEQAQVADRGLLELVDERLQTAALNLDEALAAGDESSGGSDAELAVAVSIEEDLLSASTSASEATATATALKRGRPHLAEGFLTRARSAQQEVERLRGVLEALMFGVGGADS